MHRTSPHHDAARSTFDPLRHHVNPSYLTCSSLLLTTLAGALMAVRLTPAKS